MKTITGKVTRIGKVKDYGEETNWGKDWIPDYKFFMAIDSKEHGEILSMVECKADQTNYGYKIPKDADRQKPFIGDRVKITTHRIRENGAKWASVTFNQSYEITKENKTARKEREAWIAEQKKTREDAFQKKVDETKQHNLDLKLEELGHLETQKYDDRFPESVRDVMNKTFNFDKVLGLLRATVWFVTPEGEGGKQAVYSLSGVMLEEGYPGTGLRRPGGCLHGHPASVRKSILNKAIDSGLIVSTEKGYKATEMGIKLLVKIDVCPECNELRKPVSTYSHYSNPATGYSQTTHHGACYYCKHEMDEILECNRGCNCGTTFKDYKSTESKFEKIMKIARET